MDLDPRNVLNLLHEYLEDENTGPKECYQLLTNFNESLIQQQLNLSYIDSCLPCLFKKANGLPNFILNVLNKKSFKSTVISVLEIIFTLINNFPAKLEKYAFTIHEICMKVIKSLITTSDEKVKSLEVLNLSFEKISKCVEEPDHYEEIYNNLRNSILIKKSNSVQEKILITLGTYAKHFQYLIKDPENLKVLFLSQLEIQMIQKEFSYKAVNGVFTGLDQYCESFPFDLSVKEDVVVVGKLHRYIDKLAIPTTSIKVANRAALKFFANNMSLFVNLILDKYKYWHETLQKWLSYGVEEKKVGYLAIGAFYQGLGNFLLSDADHKYTHVAKYFVGYFRKVLKDSKQSNYEKRLCLHGLSSFSAAFFVQLNADEMRDLLTLIMHTFEETYVYNQDPSNEALEYLVDYVQTVAKFIYLKNITSSELFCLQKGVILMIKSFPGLPFSYHSGVIDALVMTFHCLSNNDEAAFNRFVENTIYQGVVWTCSHQHVSEAELLKGTSKKVISVKDYLYLWKGLLRISAERKYDKLEIFLPDRNYILNKIIDKLIRTMLILINKLNVSIVLTETDTAVTDIQSAYRVAEVNDFAIFLNVVDFYQEVFEEIEPTVLKKCICRLIHHLLLKCVKYPLISGFYKLLSFCLKTCNKLNYFEEANLNSVQDVHTCYQSLSQFIDIILQKTTQFKGDLLIASLQVLLEYPTVIIRKVLPNCLPSFITAFEVGRSYAKLAHMAITTLKHWQKEISNEEMEPFLVQIIPLLDSFLRSKSFGALSQANPVTRKTSRPLKKRKVLVEIEPELIQLQKRILHFIGEQSSSVCEALVSSDSNIELAVWGNQHYLKVALPYDDIKLDIYLDKLLPRIIDLALNNTDRKTRIIACELLQALMMVFLGTTKQMTHSALTDLNELLGHVAFPLLKLGCDLDQVVEQLFGPLFFQLIHWYTHRTQQRSEHSAIIIEAIMEGITHPTDSALRDFSGQCINEFIKWTIKQADENNLAQDPVNIKVLLKKMRFYSTHPDSCKRLGAALIFNSIYREIREEVSLLSMFWVEFLHVFVKSLAMYEKIADGDENSVVQINNALTHVQRGFMEKFNLFNKSDRNRRVPSDIKGDVLEDIMIWVLSQTGSKSPYCREKCMDLFCTITPYTKGYQTLQHFITNKVNKDPIWINETYESYLQQYPTLDCLKGSEDSAEPLNWMDGFLCALDGYNFVLKKHLIPFQQSVLSESFIRSVHYFIAQLSTMSLDGALAVINPKSWLFTTFQKQSFDREKAQAVRKIFQLFNLLTESQLSEQMLPFYSTDLWNFVLTAVFNRHILGFETFVHSEDDSELIELLEMFLKKVPHDKILDFGRILNDYVTTNFFTDVDFKTNVGLKHRNMLKGLIMLQSFQLDLLEFERFSNGLVAGLLNKLIESEDSDVIYVDNLQDTTQKYCLLVLDFSLNSRQELKSLIEFFYKPYQIQSFEYNQPIHFGRYIFTTFEESIAGKIIENFELFLSVSVQEHIDMLNHTIEYILLLLNYVITRKELRKYQEGIVMEIVKNWATFEKYFHNEKVELGIELLKNILPILKKCNTSYNIFKKWLINLLICNKNVSGKPELDLEMEIVCLLEGLVGTAEDENVDFQTNLVYVKNKFFLDATSLPLEIRITALDRLFCTAPKMKSVLLLTFVMDVYARLPTEQSNVDVKTLLKGFIMSNKEDVQTNSLRMVYELCHHEDLDNFQKYKLVTTLVPLFQYCDTSVFEEFFVTNIPKLFSVLKESLTHANLIKKVLHFVLLEILFLRCPINSADTEISPITRAALPDKANNKTFILQILKFTLNAFKDELEVTSESELFRLYKCQVYNAMVSVISNSMKDSNFYNKLFVRQENNSDILWTSIIDTRTPYVFQTDFESIPKRKKILVNIRNEVRARKRLEDSQIKTVKYLESMRLYQSSLCEDLTKFDFTHNVVRSQSDENLEGEEKSDVQSEIELDCTDVNNHECMASICGLIDHMVRANIVMVPDEDGDEYELPAWLKGIRELLLSKDTHDNVKIFWVKVIDNTMHVFKHFAKWFMEPFLKFVVDRCAGSSINYFITDVISVLASWSADVIPKTDTEIDLASQLLTFLIEQLNNTRQDMFKYHLELIKLLVEAWKAILKTPHDLIYSKLNVDVTSRGVEIGIHLSSILLVNNITPWRDGGVQDFCKLLFNIVMKSKLKSVYKPCCETIGLLLRFLSGDQYFTRVSGNLHLLLKKIEDPDKYAHVLEAIALHYPAAADEYNLNRLLSKIHAVPKDLKAVYLRIILNRSDAMDTASDFKTEAWHSYIENDSTEIQLLSLEVLYKCIDILRESRQFTTFIQSVCKHVSNPNVLCRNRMYDIAILIYQNHIPDADDKYSEVFDLCKSVLIQGMTDNDTEIREKVLNFWKNQANVPTLVTKRFSYILSNLYKTNTENDFLGYSSYLLLDTIRLKEEYNNKLFEHPLEDCDFEDYHLQTNWRVRHLSVVPLFAETLQTVSEEPGSFHKSYLNKLRQTQESLEFERTQSVRSKQITQYTMSESSLFIKPEENTSFVNPNQVALSYNYRVPKRRFLRDKSKIHKYFAQEEVKKGLKKIEERKDLAKERDNKVTIYRKYRKGDLPDVQITLQAILEPLQVLTLHDSELSKILFLEIYKSILKHAGNNSDFMNDISSSIKYIFNNSVHYNRNLFGALFDVLLLTKNPIIVQPELIASISQASGLPTLGVLLLEEFLINHDDDPSDSKRTRGQQANIETNYWVKLAELHKELDEWDLVKSIFLEKMDCKENVKEALLAESQKQWRDAQTLYRHLIETDETLERRDFYYESYFKCFAYLGEWDNLVKTIEAAVGGNEKTCWDSLWDQDWNQQKLLPWYINGQLKNALFSRNTPHQFFSDLNKSLNSENAEYLQNHFSEELAVLWLFKKEPDEAEQCSNTYIDNFLSYWQLLDPLYSTLRYNKLMRLRNVIDIKKFISVLQRLNVDGAMEIRNLVAYWDRTANENLSSILLCEEKVLYRGEFVNLLTKKIQSLEDSELQELIAEINRAKLKQDESLINTGIEQNNFYLTKKYLTSCTSMDVLKLKLCLSKIGIIKSGILSDSHKKLDLLLEASKILAPIFDSNNQHLKLLASVQMFSNFKHTCSFLQQDDELFQSRIADIRLITSDTISCQMDIMVAAVGKLQMFLNKYTSELNNQMDTENWDEQDCPIVANAYMELAYFAKEQGKGWFTDFIRFVLKAMKYNSVEGRQLFPCILMEKEFSEQNKALFIEETEKIPLWMFLGWISQLLVNVDSDKVGAVAPVLLRISKSYPQAIMYSYRLSKENYTFKNTSTVNESKTLIQQLDGLLLNDERIDKFLKALSFVGVPAAIVSYYVKKMIKACNLNDAEGFKAAQENLLNQVFENAPNSKDIEAMQGSMFIKTQKYKKDVINLTRARDAEKLKCLKRIDGELLAMLQNRKEKISISLKDYSPWLAHFSSSKANLDLEIPGQYDGKRMPLVQHHAKISGFCPNVSVISSLRKPIKITILGDNTKEYPFLVKFGEDIRQDQRIQQLFTLMNDVFANDKVLNDRQISILTYQVVPLTTSLGIIQWIDNTTSLQDFMKKTFKNDRSAKIFDSTREIYQNCIFKSNGAAGDAYGLAAINYSRDKTIPKYRSLVNAIQWDILRSAFLEVSANTESFAALRDNFIKSYAVMCISQWILGVGDRHLSNSLVCSKNGKILGIDFGHAFGTATQILPVPELVPFRLTPHIVSFMEPLGVRGLFRETMIRCLRSLRHNTGSLLATMNVFIEEPSLDWLEQASRFGDTDPTNCEWYPAQKIDQAKRKLCGVNSVTIMSEDLTAGHQRNKRYLNAYLRLVQGSPEHDDRARKGTDGLSVEDQVDCLIDHATDYNLLGRMFDGWMAWV